MTEPEYARWPLEAELIIAEVVAGDDELGQAHHEMARKILQELWEAHLIPQAECLRDFADRMSEAADYWGRQANHTGRKLGYYSTVLRELLQGDHYSCERDLCQLSDAVTDPHPKPTSEERFRKELNALRADFEKLATDLSSPRTFLGAVVRGNYERQKDTIVARIREILAYSAVRAGEDGNA